MKIDLFDVEEFIKINNLKEITSPVIFQQGDIPNPDGLLSNEIFGVTTKSRKETFAYIDLGGYFFHPHIYKAIRRMFRNIDKIVNGELFYSLDKNGRLVEDNENGQTGIEFLYDNWDKINWTKEGENTKEINIRHERENLLKVYKRNEIFMHYQIVIPVFYRDITTGTRGATTDDINNLYTKLIRYATLIKNKNMFDFQFTSTNYNIQTTLIDIYDYFKQKIEKKNGLIRRYLMGKSVDNCTRAVITAPTFHSNTPEDAFVSFQYSALPMSHVLSLAAPFIVQYLKNFFERELIDQQEKKPLYDSSGRLEKLYELDNPESYFNDRYINKMINEFIRDPESRFKKIEVPIKSKDKKRVIYLLFTGYHPTAVTKADIPELRPMTVCDLLYMACEYVTRNKHTLITRYPINDEFGVFVSRIRVSSTTKTVPLVVNGYLYKWYPLVEPKTPLSEVGSKFIDAVKFSHSYLKGIEGDYDGDQTTVKILWTQEANEECERVMFGKSFFINASGKCIRNISNEATQTFFVLTKDPFGKYKPLTKEQKDYFIKLDPKDITLDNLSNWFGNLTTVNDSKEGKKPKPSPFNVCDTLHINPGEYKLVKDPKGVDTTIGRLIFNKVFVEGTGFMSLFNYVNKVMTAGEFKGFENVITFALKDDKITTKQMVKYIDTRDWFGLILHGIITSSFTPNTIKLPPKTKALRDKLMEDNKEALARGDADVMEQIENKIIASIKEELKDDIGMDLYNSGARGSVSNNMKNILISRGAVANPATGEFEIINNALMDGLEKKDIPTHANVIVTGAYPKAVGTQVSGYMSKELLSAFQSETLGPKGSDCGSLRTIKITLTEKNFNDYAYRYIKDNGKLVELNQDNRSKYVGKTVDMRSPIYCAGVGKNRNICNKCAGNYYYNMGKKNIGLLTSRIATTLTQMGMQKFHSNTVNMKLIDPNDILL